MKSTSYPNTKKKAKKLRMLLDKPLLQKNAEHDLYYLCRDPVLYDEIRTYDEDNEVSHLVRYQLAKWLSDTSLFVKPWEPKAIKICHKILADNPPIYDTKHVKINTEDRLTDSQKRHNFCQFVSELATLSKKTGIVVWARDGIYFNEPGSNSITNLYYNNDHTNGDLIPENYFE